MTRQISSGKRPDELVWGIHPVLELLRSRPGRISSITVQKSKTGPKIREIISLADDQQIPVHSEPRLLIPGPGRPNHQGVMALVKPAAPVSLAALIERLKARDPAPILLALDCIQDPHNLGAIIRTAAAAGVDGILVPKNRTAPLAGTTAKAAAGGLALVDICQVTNLVRVLKQLQQEGFWIFGAAGEADRAVYEADFSGPVCLVIGGEHKGLRPRVRENCDFLVSIPITGIGSLNASVAAGVILFEIVRQRGK